LRRSAMADVEDGSASFEEALDLPAARGGADDKIQVLVRVRPPNARELEQVRLLGDITKRRVTVIGEGI
jgi:hypothetical protein